MYFYVQSVKLVTYSCASIWTNQHPNLKVFLLLQTKESCVSVWVFVCVMVGKPVPKGANSVFWNIDYIWKHIYFYIYASILDISKENKSKHLVQVHV